MFEMSKFHLDLYLIRHAQSTANANPEIICGQSNHVKLTDKGEKQATSLGKSLAAREIQFDEIYSSVAVRAHQTAQLACKEIGQDSQIVISDELVEISRGSWEGTHRDIHFTEPVLKDFFENPWTFKSPDGESCEEVEERMHNWIKQNLLSKTNGEMKRVAIFSHGTAIRCLLRRLLDSSPGIASRTAIRNTAVTRLMLNDYGWWPRYINEYVHIRGID